MKQIFLVFFMLGLGISTATASTLRVTCDDQATGAEISINGKYKGECPIDIQVNEGKHSLKAVKKIDGKDAIFQEQVRMGDGVTKRIEVTFGASASSAAPAAAIRVDQNAVARQRYEIEMAEYNKSIQSCLPKYVIEKRRLKNAVDQLFKIQYNECLERRAEIIGDDNGMNIRRQQCGESSWDGKYSYIAKDWPEYDEYRLFADTKEEWCEDQFTKPKAP